MVNVGVMIVTLIIGHTTGALSLGHLLKQKGMIPFFDP
jgi:hypothetical protein